MKRVILLLFLVVSVESFLFSFGQPCCQPDPGCEPTTEAPKGEGGEKKKPEGEEKEEKKEKTPEEVAAQYPQLFADNPPFPGQELFKAALPEQPAEEEPPAPAGLLNPFEGITKLFGLV